MNADILSKIEPYALYTRIIVSFEGIDIEILLNRTSSIANTAFQIIDGMFYSKLDLEEGQVDNLLSEQPRVHRVADFQDFILRDPSSDKMSVFPMTISQVMRWNLIPDRFSTFSYKPTPYEKELFPSYSFNKVFSEVEIEKILDSMHKINAKVNQWEANPDKMEEDDIKSFMTELSTKQAIGMEELKIYMSNRHELLAFMVCAHLNIPAVSTDTRFKMFPDFSDIIFSEQRFDIQTPDVIFKVGTVVYIVDFFVTDASPMLVASEKRKKYREATMELQAKYTHLEIKFVALGIQGTRGWYCDCSDETFTSLDKSAIANQLYNYRRGVETIPNYRQMKLVHDRMEITKAMDNGSCFDELVAINMILGSKSSGKGSFKMSDGFNPIKAGKLEHYTKHDIKSVKDDNEKLMQTTRDTTLAEAELVILKQKLINGDISQSTEKLVADSKDLKIVPEEIKKQMKIMYEASSEFPEDKVGCFCKLPYLETSMSATEVPLWADVVEDGELAGGELLLKGMFEGYESSYVENKEKHIGFHDSMYKRLEEFIFSITGSDALIDFEERVNKSELMEYLTIIQELAREIMLNADKRFAKGPSGNKMLFKKLSFCSIIIANGPKLKHGSSVFFKILTDKPSKAPPKTFHQMHPTKETNIYETKWLSLQLADLKHFLKIKSVTKVIMSNMRCKLLESNCNIENGMKTMTPRALFMTPIMVLLEHRRNTSTSLQVARYVVHSCLALVSDRVKLVKEIFETPIRSYFQGHCVKMIALWMAKTIEADTSKLNEAFLEKMGKMDNTTDQIFLSSIFDDKEIPFSVTMEEIYYVNLFNPYSGFAAHRQKPILQKIIEYEKKYLENVKNGSVFRGIQDLFFGKDEFCTLSCEFLRLCMRDFMSKVGMKEALVKGMIKACTCGIDKVMKMTRSVTAIPDDYDEFVDSSNVVQKSTVFEAIWEQVERLEEVDLQKMVETDNQCLAIFSTFAKPQWGNAREILIQCIKTRIHTTMFNTLFEELCKVHEKDMTTKDRKKRELQSQSVLDMAEKAAEINSQEKNKLAVPLSINSDASKWAQSQIMVWYSLIIDESRDLMAPGLYDLMMTIPCAYAAKLIYVPTTIMDKLKTWTQEMIDKDPIIQEAQMFSNEDGLMLIVSGMGQGNFQHGSGFAHCIIDDLSDKIVIEIFQAMGCTVIMVTLISSDDSTKILLLIILKQPKMQQVLNTIVKIFLDCYSGFRKCGNIHINWKKTALQMILTEFNSTFSILKRMYTAAIKSVYNSCNIVDLSRPKDACLEAIANIRRLRDDGCYKPTIDIAMSEMKANIETYYGIDKPMKASLCELLKCEEEDLPVDLGFLPNKFSLEVLTYGTTFLMFQENLSDELKAFYNRMYASSEISNSEFEGEEDMEVADNATIEVAIRGDKQLRELKEKVLWNQDYDPEVLDNRAMDDLKKSKLLASYYLHQQEYLMAVKRNYGFSDSYEMHSLIRALQYTTKLKFTGTSDVLEGIVAVVERVLSITNYVSHIRMLSHFRELANEIIEINKLINGDTMAKKAVNRHPKYRQLTFFQNMNYEYYTFKGISEAIFSSKGKVTTMHLKAIRDIADMLGVPFYDFRKDPLSTIISSQKRPLYYLKKVIRLYIRFFSDSSQILLSDFSTSSSRYEDLLALHCYKSDPRHVLVRTTLKDRGQQYKQVHNFISFAEEPMWNALGFIKPSDTKETAAIKAFSTYNQSKNINQSKKFFDHHSKYYSLSSKKNRSEKKFYISSLGVLLLEFPREGILEIEAYGELNLHLKERLFTNAKVFLGAKESNKVVYYDGSEYKELIIADLTRIEHMISCKPMPQEAFRIMRSSNMWRIEYIFREFTIPIYESVYKIYLDSADKDKPDLMKEMETLMYNRCTLREVDDFMKKLMGDARVVPSQGTMSKMVDKDDDMNWFIKQIAMATIPRDLDAAFDLTMPASSAAAFLPVAEDDYDLVTNLMIDHLESLSLEAIETNSDEFIDLHEQLVSLVRKTKDSFINIDDRRILRMTANHRVASISYLITILMDEPNLKFSEYTSLMLAGMTFKKTSTKLEGAELRGVMKLRFKDIRTENSPVTRVQLDNQVSSFLRASFGI